MIMLTAGSNGNCSKSVPPIAVQVAKELPNGGSILILEQGDDIECCVPQAGRFGLLTHLDDHWQEPFSWVRSVQEQGHRWFVARLAYGKWPVVIVAADADWLDSRLRLVLDTEAEEAF